MFKRNLAAVPPQTFGARRQASRSPATRIVESLRTGLREFLAWRGRCHQRKELYEFLASDHRAAANIGYRHWQP